MRSLVWQYFEREIEMEREESEYPLDIGRRHQGSEHGEVFVHLLPAVPLHRNVRYPLALHLLLVPHHRRPLPLPPPSPRCSSCCHRKHPRPSTEVLWRRGGVHPHVPLGRRDRRVPIQRRSIGIGLARCFDARHIVIRLSPKLARIGVLLVGMGGRGERVLLENNSL